MGSSCHLSGDYRVVLLFLLLQYRVGFADPLLFLNSNNLRIFFNGCWRHNRLQFAHVVSLKQLFLVYGNLVGHQNLSELLILDSLVS